MGSYIRVTYSKCVQGALLSDVGLFAVQTQAFFFSWFTKMCTIKQPLMAKYDLLFPLKFKDPCRLLFLRKLVHGSPLLEGVWCLSPKESIHVNACLFHTQSEVYFPGITIGFTSSELTKARGWGDPLGWITNRKRWAGKEIYGKATLGVETAGKCTFTQPWFHRGSLNIFGQNESWGCLLSMGPSFAHLVSLHSETIHLVFTE